MADEVGAFIFGTNMSQVANEISSGASQIRSTLSQPLIPAQQKALIATGVGGTFESLNEEFRRTQDKLRASARELQAGLIDRTAFRAQVRDAIGGSIGQIPQMMTEGLARAPRVAADKLNAKEFGSSTARGYVNGFNETLRQLKADFPAVNAMGATLGNAQFKDLVKGVTNRPIDLERATPLAALETIARAERMVAANPAPREPLQAEIDAGLADITGQLRQDLGTGAGRVRRPQKGKTTFEASDVEEQIGALRRQERQAEQTAASINKLREAEERRQGRLRLGRQVFETGRRGAGGYLLGDGSVAAKVTGGYDPITDPVRAQEVRASVAERERKERERQEAEVARRARAAEDERVRREELENRRFLAQNLQRSQQVPRTANVRTLDGDFYEMYSKGGEARARILGGRAGDEARIVEYLARQRDATEALLRSQQALAVTEERRRITAANAAQNQALRTQRGQQGFLGGFMQRFQRGEQSILTGLGGQAASAAAFSLAYGSIYGLQRAIRDTLSEFLDYQDSVTDLEVATRSADVVTGDWVNTLSELSRLSGANVGAALDAAARGVRAFADFGADPDEIRAVGTATAETANQLALIAGKDLVDATGDTVAVGSAFGLEADQLNQITDAVANAKRNVGGDANQISQGLALISLSAQEAGFNLNEAAAVIGLVQARTDQSGQAIATRLTRIFQIIQGSTGKTLGRQLGVDTDQSARDQLLEYAKIYNDPNTPETQRDRILSLAGTANQRELLPLLTESTTLLEAFDEGARNAGQGEDEFARKTNNLVGTLKKIAGDISNIQVNLAKSGLFDAVGASFQVLEPVLYTINSALAGFNAFTDAVPGVKMLTGALIDLLLVSKAIAVVQKSNLIARGVSAVGLGAVAGGRAVGAAGRGGVGARAGVAVSAAGAGLGTLLGDVFTIGGRQRARDAAAAAEIVARQNEVRAIVGLTQARLVAEGRINAAIALSSQQRLLVERAGAGAAAASTAAGAAAGARAGTVAAGAGMLTRFALNPATIAAAAVIATAAVVGTQLDNGRSIGRARSQADDTAKTFERNDSSTAAGTLAISRDYTSAVQRISKIDVGGTLSGRRGELDRILEPLQDRALALAIAAADVSREEAAMADAGDALFGSATGAVTSVNQLASGMADLAARGADADTQVRAMFKALNREALPDGATELRPESLKSDIRGGLYGSLEEVLKANPVGTALQTEVARFTANKDDKGKRVPVIRDPFDVEDFIGSAGDPLLDRGRFDAAIDAEISRLGLSSGDLLSSSQLEKIVRAAVDVFNLDSIGGDKAALADALVEATLTDLSAFTPEGTTSDLLNGKGQLNSAQIQAILFGEEDTGQADRFEGTATKYFGDQLASIPKSDDGTQLLATLRFQAEKYEELAARALKPEDEQVLLTLAANARHDYREAALEEAETIRRAAESRAKDDADLKRIQARFAVRSGRVTGGEAVLLEQLFADLSDDAIDAVVRDFRRIRNIARAGLRAAEAAENAALIALGSDADLEGGPRRASLGPLDNLGADTKRKRKRFSDAQSNLDNVNRARSRTELEGSLDAEDELTARQLRTRRAAAKVESGRTVQQATADLNVSKADLAAASDDKKSQEYLDALKAVRDGERTLASAVAERATAAANLAAARAGGGQLAQAKAALDIANAQITATTPGTAERDNALAARIGARRQRRDARAAKADALGQVAAEISGGGAQAEAKAELDAATRNLNRQREGTVEFAEAQLRFLTAESAMADTALAASVSANNLAAAKAGGGQMAQATAGLKNARDALAQETPGTIEWDDALAGLYEARTTMANAAAAKTGAIAGVRAARLGGSGIASAKAALIGARANLEAQVPDTIEYFEALAGLYQAQYQMKDAVQAYAATRIQLRGDITDPVEQARDALRIAARQYRVDRRQGAGRDTLAADRLARRQARAGLEQTRFDQRLSDMQGKEQRDQITFQQYMRYLDNEHDRLEKIKNRTYQQQQQLNTIDDAIKAANNEMDAQFNFGSINTRGLVYQARRYAAEQVAQLDARAGTGRVYQNPGRPVLSSVSIYIDGADTAKVRRVVEETLGGGPRIRTQQTRRR